jgi:hypothetical protein
MLCMHVRVWLCGCCIAGSDVALPLVLACIMRQGQQPTWPEPRVQTAEHPRNLHRLDSASTRASALTTSRSSAAATFSFTSSGRLVSYSSCTANAVAASAAAAASSASRLCCSSACQQTCKHNQISTETSTVALTSTCCLAAHSRTCHGDKHE